MDCLLTSPDGIDRACTAITNVWSRMTTPGIWISVSHSPPGDRTDLYSMSSAATAGASSVYWHDIQVAGGGLLRVAVLGLVGSFAASRSRRRSRFRGVGLTLKAAESGAWV